MWVVVTVVAVVVLIATYVTWSASRVDRLHARAAAAFSALDAQSVRRAAAAAEVGGDDVQAAARAVLTAHPDDRETAENGLTRSLRTWLDKAGLDKVGLDKVGLDKVGLDKVGLDTAGPDLAAGPAGPERRPGPVEALADASRRLALARQVYTDLARDALAVRRHPVVRLLGLSRRHPAPRFFDIDDPTLDEPM